MILLISSAKYVALRTRTKFAERAFSVVTRQSICVELPTCGAQTRAASLTLAAVFERTLKTYRFRSAFIQ